MLHIFCPHCGELRSEEEFHAAGQAHIPRPLDPNACTDEQWGDYLFMRKNPKGQHFEQWLHSSPDHGLAWQRLEQRIGQAFSTAPGLSREVLDRAGSSRRHLLRGALSVTGLGLGAWWL